MPDFAVENITLLAKALEEIREEVKDPIFILSGYRDSDYNAAVGGAPDSQHLLGKAADIQCKNLTPRAVARVIERLIKEKRIPQGGIGIYKSWVHYDIRGTRARWF